MTTLGTSISFHTSETTILLVGLIEGNTIGLSISHVWLVLGLRRRGLILGHQVIGNQIR